MLRAKRIGASMTSASHEFYENNNLTTGVAPMASRTQSFLPQPCPTAMRSQQSVTEYPGGKRVKEGNSADSQSRPGST